MDLRTKQNLLRELPCSPKKLYTVSADLFTDVAAARLEVRSLLSWPKRKAEAKIKDERETSVLPGGVGSKKNFYVHLITMMQFLLTSRSRSFFDLA